MSDPNHAHDFSSNRDGRCKQIIGGRICGEPGLARVHVRWLIKEAERVSALDVVLDEIEEYLDNLSDCEGNGPADARPNQEMRLLCALRDARERAK